MKGKGIERELKEEDREEEKISTSIPFKISQTAIWSTGLNIANKIKYIYIILFLLQNYRNLKKNL